MADLRCLSTFLEQDDPDDAHEITGRRLIKNHVFAIWYKTYLIRWRSWRLALLQVVAALLLVNVTLLVVLYATRTFDDRVQRPLTLEKGYKETVTLLSYFNASKTSMGAKIAEEYKKYYENTGTPGMRLKIMDTSLKLSLSQYYLVKGHDPDEMRYMRQRVLIGAEFKDAEVTAYFSAIGYHGVAVTLATVYKAMLRALSPQATMTVYNHPLEAQYKRQADTQKMIRFLASQLSSAIGNSLAIVTALFVVFYVRERASRAKLLQRAAGVSPVIMWGAAALWDWAWLMIINVIIILSFRIHGVTGFNTLAELNRVFLVMSIFEGTFLPFIYLMSFVFAVPGNGFVTVYFINIMVGDMAAQIVDVLWTPGKDTHASGDVIDAIAQFFPLYSLVTAVRRLNQIGIFQNICLSSCSFLMETNKNITKCDVDVMCNHYAEFCCMPSNPHFRWAAPGVSRYIFMMIFSGVVFWTLLMLIEFRLLQKVFSKEKEPPPIDHILEEDVTAEANFASNVDKGDKEVALVAVDLTKYYKEYLAVNRVSFTVRQAECFGLLGVNGAGKTTTFKMLMGDERISYGDAYICGHSVKTEMTKIYQRIGYCPQFDAVFGELTGRENMKFFAMLRGLHPRTVAKHTKKLAQVLGLTKHLDKRSDQYSGGNRRKLSTAVALLGKSRLIFVDEPTTGIDPAARRQVWTTIQEARSAGRSVVITSHSMEECEALCSRLTIMVSGTFQCMGTPQHLKNKFSQGFTLLIKMVHNDGISKETQLERVLGIKQYVDQVFPGAKIMEQYQGLLTYYLPGEGMPWSQIFKHMEHAKRELHVEDYNISQTTLEQIFLQFTKYQEKAVQTPRRIVGIGQD